VDVEGGGLGARNLGFFTEPSTTTISAAGGLFLLLLDPLGSLFNYCSSSSSTC
jgi:hypothetical protein